jgi:plasmid stabilization system protein ParE
MSFEVVRSAAAAADLLELADWIASHDSPATVCC